MVKRVTVVGLFLFVSVFATVLPVNAQFGMTKTTVNLEIAHAPNVPMPGESVEIVVESESEGADAMLTPVLRYFESKFEEAGFELTADQPDLRMHVVVSPFNQRISVLYGEENHHIKVASKCKQTDVFVRRVRVNNSSSYTLEIEAVGSGERVFDTNMPVRDFVDLHVKGPELCDGYSYGARPDLTRLDDLSEHFVALAGGRVQDDLFGRISWIDVMIAKPDALKPGNKFARVGEWEDALEIWATATFKKASGEAYRFYNVGVANEALAYANIKDLDRASAYLQLADDAYKEALKLRPKEKYFRPAFDRIRAAENILEAWTEYRDGSQRATR